MRFGKISRTVARTIGEAIGISGAQAHPEEMQLLAGDLLNGGMVTAIHSHKLQNNQVTFSQGNRVRFDGLERRYGHDILTPAKPNSNSILLYGSFKRNDSTIKLYRFTKNSIHLYGVGAWTAVTGAALAGTDTDRFQMIGIVDRLFFANNGANVLQEINIGANTYAAAGNAKKYKYYTSIYNRIVGVNLNDAIAPNPIEMGWSGDLAPTQWDSTIDPSAGTNILLESGGGAGDFTTGIFNIDNTLLITRERSIWVCDLSPIATFPFLPRQVVPNIGAGIPYAIAQIKGGIAWYDNRLNNVFSYTIGEKMPVAIGDTIKKQISIPDINNVFAGYDPENNEYILGVIQANSIKVALYIYNFDTGSWVYDEMTNISGIWYLDYSRASTTIGELVGTIGDLVGTIGGLSTNVAQSTEFVGKNNGDLLVQNDTVTLEGGLAFSSIITSKDYKMTVVDTYVAQLKLIYQPIIAGSIIVSYSIDGGDNYIVYKTVDYGSSSTRVQRLVKFVKQINCRQFRWKIETTNGRCKLVEYEIHVFPGSSSRGE